MSSAFLPPVDRFRHYLREHHKFPKELEEGNVEYKLKLNPTAERFEHLLSQMKWRLYEYGICYYLVGVDDDGHVKCTELAVLEHSFKVLEELASGCAAHVLEKRIILLPSDDLRQRMFMQVCIGKTKQHIEEGWNGSKQVNVCLLGPEGSGKSTLAACINSSDCGSFADGEVCNFSFDHQAGLAGTFPATKINENFAEVDNQGLCCAAMLDDGKGSMRMQMLRHRHEILSGKTSSISYRYTASSINGTPFRLIDTPGCVKYKNTLLRCLTTHQIDICIVVLESNDASFVDSFCSFYSLCTALKIPVILVCSKVDCTLKEVIDESIRILHENNSTICFEEVTCVSKALAEVYATCIIPVVSVSCITGKGLDVLWSLLQQYKPLDSLQNVDAAHSSDSKRESEQKHKLTNIENLDLYSPSSTSNHFNKIVDHTTHKFFKFCIEKTLYLLEGTVVYGYVKKGTIERCTRALIGPLPNGSFIPIIVRTIMQDRRHVESIAESSSASLLIELSPEGDINDSNFSLAVEVQAGMVIVDDSQISCGRYKTFCLFECQLIMIPAVSVGRSITGRILVRGSYHDCTISAIKGASEQPLDHAADQQTQAFEVHLLNHAQRVYVRPADKLYFSTGTQSAIGAVTRVLLHDA